MRPIIVISLLVLVITLFLIPSVNGAPLNSKKGVTSSTVAHKSSTPSSHNKSSQQSTTPGKTHSSGRTTRSSTTKSTKNTRLSTAKITTAKRKASTKTSKPQAGRKKRLTQWNWE